MITLDELDEKFQIKEEIKSESEMDLVCIPSTSTQEIPFNEDLTQGD